MKKFYLLFLLLFIIQNSESGTCKKKFASVLANLSFAGAQWSARHFSNFTEYPMRWFPVTDQAQSTHVQTSRDILSGDITRRALILGSPSSTGRSCRYTPVTFDLDQINKILDDDSNESLTDTSSSIKFSRPFPCIPPGSTNINTSNENDLDIVSVNVSRTEEGLNMEVCDGGHFGYSDGSPNCVVLNADNECEEITGWEGNYPESSLVSASFKGCSDTKKPTYGEIAIEANNKLYYESHKTPEVSKIINNPPPIWLPEEVLLMKASLRTVRVGTEAQYIENAQVFCSEVAGEDSQQGAETRGSVRNSAI